MMVGDMAKRPPVTEDEREQIISMIRSGLSARAVARESGRSVDTVSRIARDISWTFGRTNLARARQARSAFCAERRAVAASLAQERAEELLVSFLEPQTVVTGNGTVVEVPVDARGVKDRAQAYQLLQRTVLDVSKHDVKADEGNAGALLLQFVDQLRGPDDQAA